MPIIFITNYLWINMFLGGIAMALLVLSARIVVDRSVEITKYYEVSDKFLGLTVLAISTSLPEVVMHIMASVWIVTEGVEPQVASSVALGTNIGACILRQTLIFGIFVIIVRQLKLTQAFLRESFGAMIVASVIVWIMAFDGTLARIDGAILLFLFGVYMFGLSHFQSKRIEEDKPKKKIIVRENSAQHRMRFGTKPHIQLLWVGGGLFGLMLISLYLIALAEHTIEELEIGGSLAGIVCLGIVSALPELITAIRGVQKKLVGVWVGTLVGSNTINLLLAVGIGSLLAELTVPLPWFYCDLPILIGTALMTLLWIALGKFKMGLPGAVFLVLMYGAFIYLRLTYFILD